jgi:hypothetical protein
MSTEIRRLLLEVRHHVEELPITDADGDDLIDLHDVLAVIDSRLAGHRKTNMPTSSNYLCGCGRFMMVKRNSVTVEELLEDGAPYKLWDADLMECPECGVTVIAGFGRQPLAQHWQPSYQEQRARLAPIYPGRCRNAE